MDELEQEMWELQREHERLLYTPKQEMTHAQRIVLLGTIRALENRIRAYKRLIRKEKKQ